VVWNRSAPWGNQNHRFNHVRSLHAAQVIPAANRSDSPLDVRPAPSTYLGEAGRLPVPALPFLHSNEHEFVNPQAPRIRLGWHGPVVFYRSFRSAEFKDYGWDIHALALVGDSWSAPQQVSRADGFPDTPYGVLRAPAASDSGSDDWLLAYHAGEYTRSPDQAVHPSKPVAGHRLQIERVTLNPQPAGKGSSRNGESAVVKRSAAARAVAARERRQITAGGATYEALWGDLHRHSHLSKCMSANDGDPLDHWRWARDVGQLDFYALTEHIEYLSDLEWHRVTELAQQLAAGGVLALCGFEFSNFPGHTNFFFIDEEVAPDLRAACLTVSNGSLADLWPQLDRLGLQGRILAVRHNQSSGGGGLGRGWHDAENLEATHNPRYERIVEGIQSRGEYKEWLRSLWRRGFRVGVVGATDHSRAAPFPQAITGVWVTPEERTRAGVMRGLHARRTFATNGVRLSVYLSAAATEGEAQSQAAIGMGEQGIIRGPVLLRIQVQARASWTPSRCTATTACSTFPAPRLSRPPSTSSIPTRRRRQPRPAANCRTGYVRRSLPKATAAVPTRGSPTAAPCGSPPPNKDRRSRWSGWATTNAPATG
jgi:hypothetical protein